MPSECCLLRSRRSLHLPGVRRALRHHMTILWMRRQQERHERENSELLRKRQIIEEKFIKSERVHGFCVALTLVRILDLS